jgi:SAM-dependent methyltransferase
MLSLLTPDRRRGVEILDDPSIPDDVRERAMNDVARANRWFGGTRSVRLGFQEVARDLQSPALLLDVGTGTGDIAAAVEEDVRRWGGTLSSFGIDISPHMARIARRQLAGAVVGSALRIPLADNSVDVVSCSQVLHHFADDDARRLIAELHRVSRRWVIISDLRRSWAAAGGWWLASGLLRFHEVTRSDGMVSVLRGFAGTELADLVRDVTGCAPRVRRSSFWRLTATWKKRDGVA